MTLPLPIDVKPVTPSWHDPRPARAPGGLHLVEASPSDVGSGLMVDGITAHPADPDRCIVPVTGDELLVTPISHREAATAVIEFHYLHRKPHISVAFGIVDHDKNIRGVITYGTPASRHLQVGVNPADPGSVIELNRMWIDDDMPRGVASWFIARTLKKLPPKIVVSYADTTRGHMGYVYRAANFRYSGWTDMERKTPRYDYIPLQEGAHTREAFRTGYGERIRRKPKVKYWTVTGNKADRRALAAACQWLTLSWSEEPPPSEHRFRPSRPTDR